MRPIDWLAAILVIVGGLNWGLVAIAEFDLVATVVGLDFGAVNALSRVIYGLVGLSAIWLAVRLPMLATSPATAERHELRSAPYTTPRSSSSREPGRSSPRYAPGRSSLRDGTANAAPA